MLIYKILSFFIYIIFIPVFLFSAIILITVGLLYLPLFYRLDKICCRLIMSSLLVWPRLYGVFPTEGTYIIMMNHSCFLDVFIFPLIPKGAWTGVTATENFKIPVFSLLIRRIKAIPIDRKNSSAAIESIKKAEDVLKGGIHIGILPEGTRTLDGKIQPLKKGGFHMAINTNTPIIPVGVSGAFEFKPKNRWWMKPCLVTINIGDPISVDDYTMLGVDGISTKVENLLKSLSGETNENK